MHQINHKKVHSITDLWLDILYSHGLGICLSKSIHALFHNLYGRKEFVTPANFNKFVLFLESGRLGYKFISKKNEWRQYGIPEEVIEKYCTKSFHNKFFHTDM